MINNLKISIDLDDTIKTKESIFKLSDNVMEIRDCNVKQLKHEASPEQKTLTMLSKKVLGLMVLKSLTRAFRSSLP